MDRIPFTLTAALLNALDSTPLNIVTDLPCTYVYVPKYVTLWKQAGTAYTLSPGQETDIARTDKVESDDSASDLHGFRGSGLLLTEVQRVTGTLIQERAVFHIPTKGFLDLGAASGRLVLPLSNIKVFRTGSPRFRIICLDTISGGTGTVNGWLYFEKDALGQ
jgi:hypothetical protein